MLKEIGPVGTVPSEDLTVAVRTIGPGRPGAQDEVTVVVVETRGWALSDAGATALAAYGVAATIPVASMQVRAVASWERRVFCAARGRMRSYIKPSFSFSIPQSRRIIDDVP
ncbi:hypothetical protein AB0M44_41420 [Streptosporangium subroseum]|uniref:hypothetical protein n=1 Tax=Streptosporangium subroseum TaxID=106412 RepID=UPI00343ACCD1